MTTLKRLSGYLLVFVILLAGFVATGLSHSLDYFVYRTFYLDAAGHIELADNILLIDLPYRANDSDNDPTEYRLRLADLLREIAARERERPQAVVLDVWISNDARGLPELTDAITGLRARRQGAVDVYASFNPHAEGKQDAEQLWKEHAQDVYRSALTGYGHTSLNLFMGVLSYEPELQIPGAAGTTELMWALPTRVAIDMGRLDEQSSGDAVVLPVGNEDEMRWPHRRIRACREQHDQRHVLHLTFRDRARRAEAGQEDRRGRQPGRGPLQGRTAGGAEVDCVGAQRSVEARQAREAAAEPPGAGAGTDAVLRSIHGARVRPAVQVCEAPADHAPAAGVPVCGCLSGGAGDGGGGRIDAQLRHAGQPDAVCHRARRHPHLALRAHVPGDRAARKGARSTTRSSATRTSTASGW